jgi:kynureninase
VLGADVDEVAIEPNVSAGLVGVASALDYTKRPKVIVSDLDFPTDGHAFLAVASRGAQVEFVRSPDRVRVPLELFERAVDERTAAVCTGHVYFTSGWIQDVKALADICHRKGAMLVVDAYQSIGAFPFDVHQSGVDFLAGGTLKWLMGGPGMAFLYARRDVAERSRPSAVGWWGVADPFAFDVEHLRPGAGARRFEYGTPAVAAIYAARAGIELLEEIGITTVRERHMLLSQRLVDGAREQGWTVRCPTDARERTAIVTLEHPEPQRAVDALRAEGVICDSRPRLIRLSPHYFNTVDEMDRALELLAPLRVAAATA